MTESLLLTVLMVGGLLARRWREPQQGVRPDTGLSGAFQNRPLPPSPEARLAEVTGCLSLRMLGFRAFGNESRRPRASQAGRDRTCEGTVAPCAPCGRLPVIQLVSRARAGGGSFCRRFLFRSWKGALLLLYGLFLWPTRHSPRSLPVPADASGVPGTRAPTG